MLRLFSLQTETAIVTEALNKPWIALNRFQKALEEETIACRAVVFALGALERQVSNPTAEHLFVEDQNEKPTQKAVSFSDKRDSEKIDRPSPIVPTELLQILKGKPALPVLAGKK